MYVTVHECILMKACVNESTCCFIGTLLVAVSFVKIDCHCGHKLPLLAVL